MLLRGLLCTVLLLLFVMVSWKFAKGLFGGRAPKNQLTLNLRGRGRVWLSSHDAFFKYCLFRFLPEFQFQFHMKQPRCLWIWLFVGSRRSVEVQIEQIIRNLELNISFNGPKCKSVKSVLGFRIHFQLQTKSKKCPLAGGGGGGGNSWYMSLKSVFCNIWTALYDC